MLHFSSCLPTLWFIHHCRPYYYSPFSLFVGIIFPKKTPVVSFLFVHLSLIKCAWYTLQSHHSYVIRILNTWNFHFRLHRHRLFLFVLLAYLFSFPEPSSEHRNQFKYTPFYSYNPSLFIVLFFSFYQSSFQSIVHFPSWSLHYISSKPHDTSHCIHFSYIQIFKTIKTKNYF